MQSDSITVPIIFLEQLPPELTCTICEQAFRFPKRTECGHIFCEPCLQGLELCKECGTYFDPLAVRPDKGVMRRVQDLPVRCSWHDHGCKWNGVLKSLEDHASACEYREIDCPKGCGEQISIKFQEKHFNKECGRRPVFCQFCKEEVVGRGMTLHLKACRAVIVDCPNKCGLNGVTRAELVRHRRYCPLSGNACPFSEFGCNFAGDKAALQKHLSEEPIRHLTYMCDGVYDLKLFINQIILNKEKMFLQWERLDKQKSKLDKLYAAQLVWRIDDFRQRQNEARSGEAPAIFSPPFMSGRHGYKLILGAYLYGDGKLRGEFMGLFLCIMRGDYDPILQWPYNFNTVLTLLDTNPDHNRRVNVTHTITPRHCTEYMLNFQRPVSELNARFGAARFCPLETLEKYVTQDTIFLKVNIDPENGDEVNVEMLPEYEDYSLDKILKRTR